MNSTDLLRKISLPLLVSGGALYLFGIRSGVASVALLVISATVLYACMSSVLSGARAAQVALDASEQIYRHGGRNFRIFADEQGQVWVRSADVMRCLMHKQADACLARRYPLGYAKVHPQIDAWYMHQAALCNFLTKSGGDRALRLLDWFQFEVMGSHRLQWVIKPVATGAKRRRAPVAARRTSLGSWLKRLWRGEAGLMGAIFGGAIMVAGASLAVRLLQGPADITLHYRWAALVYVTQLLVVSAGMYWWGRGVLHSTQRWITAERSLLVALLASLLGFGAVFYGLSSMVDTEKQYFLTDFFTILFDADRKPEVSYDASTSRIVLDGELGFGSTNRVRQLLLRQPQARGIELKSYGGRAAEGFALMKVIAERQLETYVRAECMSACVYAYIGGWQRYAASSARFGLHRSGYAWQDGGHERNGTDESFAAFMRYLGVDEAFIDRGLKPSIQEIYEPSASEVLAANLATTEWN